MKNDNYSILKMRLKEGTAIYKIRNEIIRIWESGQPMSELPSDICDTNYLTVTARQFADQIVQQFNHTSYCSDDIFRIIRRKENGTLHVYAILHKDLLEDI